MTVNILVAVNLLVITETGYLTGKEENEGKKKERRSSFNSEPLVGSPEMNPK